MRNLKRLVSLNLEGIHRLDYQKPYSFLKREYGFPRINSSKAKPLLTYENNFKALRSVLYTPQPKGIPTAAQANITVALDVCS